jgi:hypothetical protein
MVTSHEVASLFFVTDPDEIAKIKIDPLKSCTVRMPVRLLALVDAMAENADLSRNVMVNKLLSVGIGSVLGQLPDEVREEIERDHDKNMRGAV